MENKRSAARRKFRQMEQMVTYAVCGTAALFLIYLIAAGKGTVWLSAITAVLVMAASVLGLVFLYLKGELMKRRSLWMTCAFGAMLLVLLVSLLLHYPSPKPLNLEPNTPASSSQSNSPDSAPVDAEPVG